RRETHAALAEAVADLEERARHLALAADGPDATVAVALDAAAEQAAARGATAVGAELCELAAELTPGDPAPTRARRLRAANFHRLAGNPERAAVMLEQLLPEIPHGVERADALLELALTRRADARTMVELCDQALTEATEDDERCARILAYRSFCRLFELDARGGLADARAALEKTERVGDSRLLAVAIARVGHAEAWAGEITPGLAERGVEIEKRLGRALEYYASPRVALARILMMRGKLDRARTVFQELEAGAAAGGDEMTRCQIIWRLSLLEWYAGRWREALELAHTAVELAEQVQDPHALGFKGRIQALVEADLGFTEQARSTAEEALRFAHGRTDEVVVSASLGVLGRLELALGNLEAAAGYLRDLPGRAFAGGFVDPTQPLWPDAIETLVGTGELEQARAYLEGHE